MTGRTKWKRPWTPPCETSWTRAKSPDSFLSGGVDSSYILAKGPTRCGFCVSYADQKVSEEEDARATAQYLGREFEGIEVTPEDFFGTVDEFLLAYEQPSADVAGLSLYCGCKKVKERSDLCFSGEGADEFFAGYSVYGRVKRLHMSPDPVYFGSTHIMSPSEMRRYLRTYYPQNSARAFMRNRGKEGLKYDPLTWMLYVEFRSYFEGSILFNSTKISRGTGLDIRMPFVDMRMLDVARRMPARFKRDGENNKVALRAAASRVLPQEVAYRKKLGFPVPVSSWLRDPRDERRHRARLRQRRGRRILQRRRDRRAARRVPGPQAAREPSHLVPASQGPALAPRVDHLPVHPLVRAVLRRGRAVT